MQISINDFPPVPPMKDRTHFVGDSIASVLADMGILCEFVKLDSAPQLHTYHFDLLRLSDINKVSRAMPGLSAVAHMPCRQVPSSKAHFAIEIPAEQRNTIYFPSARFLPETVAAYGRDQVRVLCGVDTEMKPVTIALHDAPHILIAGTTGSGKSSLLNTMLSSLVMSNGPKAVRLCLIDPKQVELAPFARDPHLLDAPATDTVHALNMLDMLVRTMEYRYERMARMGVKEYRAANFAPIVLAVDELADLMLTSRGDAEESIVRLAQKGRAAGIHMILCTQRPTVNVITGLIKANIPTRIALTCASVRDSMTILDHKGAEMLTGMGDAILKRADSVEEIRFQSAYCRDCDVETSITIWRK